MSKSRLPSRCAQSIAVSAITAGALGLAATAQAQETPGSLEEVVVTGSRIARTTEQGSTPVTTISADDMKLAGSLNVEEVLSETPQFVAATNGGAQSNVVPGGNAYLNLRGLGPVRNLVLVNGRRFTVQGTDLSTDINTIPAALIERTEIVTGGSSAVYGSDAIAGVTNFIMRRNFSGIQLDAHVDMDSATTTPIYGADITAGSNFADDRGNIAISFNYLDRGSIARQDVSYARPALGDGCVTPATYSNKGPGTPLAGNPTGQACLNAGGVMGLVAGGSSDIPDGRFAPTSSSLLPGGSNAALNTAYANAGLAGVGSFGWTYNDAGTTARAALDPQDRYNNSLVNYMQVPQRRWMLNAFGHYDFSQRITGYTEFHFSDNQVTALLAPSNSNGTFLYNVNNPFLTAPMRALLAQFDAAETTRICSSLNSATCTTANDGIAALSSGRRFVETGERINVSDREAWRFVGGLRGDLPDVSERFLNHLAWDAYYLYTQTNQTDHQNGAISKSRVQAGLLSVGTAAPVCNIFGLTMSAACSSSVGITSTNITKTRLNGGALSLTGTAADLWAGPLQFVIGAEHRNTFAEFSPDFFLGSGDVAGFNAASATRGSESVTEYFAEVNVPVLANVPAVDKLEINGAFRSSDYDRDAIGTVSTYSGGVDWRVIQDVSFRGQYQHAIRAPNVGELFGGQTTAFTVVNDPCSSLVPSSLQTAAVRAVCVGTGVGTNDVFTGGIQTNPFIGNTAGGNPNLESEVSNTRTFGTILTPRFVPGLSLSVDWYRIEVTGAIAQLSGGISGVLNTCYYTLQDAASSYCKAIQRDPGTGQIVNVNVGLANTGALKTEGIDFEARYAHEFGFGMLSKAGMLSISSNWTKVSQYTLVPIKERPENANRCIGAYGPTCGEPLPDLKSITRLTWSDGPLDLSLRYRFIESVTIDRYLLPQRTGGTVPPLNTLTNPKLPAENYFDLSFAWNVTKEIQFSGGVNNLFDKEPPVVGSSAGYGNTWPATYDPYGRTYFLNARMKF